MKRKFFNVFLGILLVFSCSIDDSEKSGSLSINLTNEISRTLIPGLSMNPESYEISGSGPNGAGFTKTASVSTLTVDKLDFGLWNVTVNAFNQEGIIIGTGSSEVTVHSNDTSNLTIVIRPLDGNGSLDLKLDWTAGDIETPQVSSTLLPITGTARDLGFTINGISASYNASDIPTGYHTLSLQLLDNGALTMGTIEVVRIVKDQVTVGSFTFDKVNKPGGTISVNIEQQMANPLDVVINGLTSEKNQNDDMSLTASISNYSENVTYVWYINGNSVGTGETFNLDSTYDIGYYNISVTAFSADGTMAGSKSSFVTITAPPVISIGDRGPAGGWIFYDDEADGVDDIPGFRYLEVDTTNLPGMTVWGIFGNVVAGADGYAIGTGMQNTLDIIAGDSTTNNAAHACANYTKEVNGVIYDDWFLPSIDELKEMKDTLIVNGLGDLTSDWYWSSTEWDNYNSVGQKFHDGGQYQSNKNNSHNVRPIRAF